MLNVIKEISKDESINKEEIAGIFTSIYFMYGIFQNMTIQLLVQLFMLVTLGEFISIDYVIRSNNVFLFGSLCGCVGYFAMIFFQKRKLNLTIKKVFIFFKICVKKDTEIGVFRTPTHIQIVLRKDLMRYIDIINEGKNNDLKEILESQLVGFNDLRDEDFIALQENGYYDEIEYKYKDSWLKEKEDKFEKLIKNKTINKLENF